MGTTPNGYPYPEDTDPVANGAQAIKALANAIDTRLRVTASGQVGTTVNSGSSIGSTAVTFPVGRFAAAPTTVICSTNSNLHFAYAAGITATGFTAGVRNYAGNQGSASSQVVYWIALP